MNIEKIKNYNQKLLAILGTVLLLISIVGLISIIYFAITEINRSYRYNNQDVGILSDEKIEELQQENKKQQLISYEIPRLVDTLNLVYIIPVSHKTLNSAEFIDKDVLGLMNTHRSKKIDSRYSKQYFGDFNNLLIYDYKSDNIERLFEDRVNFENIQIEYFMDDIILLFKAATKDTYKDGVINQLDYKILFLYSLKDKMLKEIKLKNADVYQIKFVENSKDLIVKFGLDHNKDGKFDVSTEPSLIKKYDFKRGELKDIVSEKINKELQMKLEGRKK